MLEETEARRIKLNELIEYLEIIDQNTEVANSNPISAPKPERGSLRGAQESLIPPRKSQNGAGRISTRRLKLANNDELGADYPLVGLDGNVDTHALGLESFEVKESEPRRVGRKSRHSILDGFRSKSKNKAPEIPVAKANPHRSRTPARRGNAMKMSLTREPDKGILRTFGSKKPKRTSIGKFGKGFVPPLNLPSGGMEASHTGGVTGTSAGYYGESGEAYCYLEDGGALKASVGVTNPNSCQGKSFFDNFFRIFSLIFESLNLIILTLN